MRILPELSGRDYPPERERNNMADTATIKLIEEKIKLVEAEGFGEVIVKVKNGVVYRIIRTDDLLIGNVGLDKSAK